MCLITSQQEPQIADKNITCYKVLRKDMSSMLYSEFKWEFGKLHKTELEPYRSVMSGPFWIKKITKAFHSYKAYKDVRGGYFMSGHPCIIVECTIPKGAMFYEGHHCDEEGYASNQLIINKVVDVKEVFTDFPWDEYPYREGQTIRIIDKGKDKGTHKIENILPSKRSPIVYLLLDKGSSYPTDRQGKSIYNYTTEIIGQPK